VSRGILIMVAGVLAWPWLSSTALGGLSLVLPQATIERAWAIPGWTVAQIPVGVAALMLVHYYRKTFTAPAGPGTS
jgi:hypothetical protein